MSQKDQKSIEKYFPNKPILYIVGLGRVFGVNSGILLSQLIFWNGMGSLAGGWIYKTIAEFETETGLSRTQQLNALQKLAKLNIIEIKYASIPRKRHLKVNMHELHKQLPSLKKTCGIKYPNPPSQSAGNMRTITESTQKLQAKRTRYGFNNEVSSMEKLLSNKRYVRAIPNDFGKGNAHE